MPRLWKFLLIALAFWLLTGVYIVGGNERAAIRRFGRVVTDSGGKILLKRNGLHFDWPWPLSRVDRINLNEIRTLNLPQNSAEPAVERQLLGEEVRPEPAFLTGDKNLLNLRLTVQYRVDESNIGEFLYGSAARKDRLACLAETAATRLLAQSGVDYVQVSGLAEWRQELARLLQKRSKEQRLGVVIEDVTLEEITPPLEVKADFLDVANARADRENIIQAALSTAESRRQAAQAEAREIRDSAQSQARETLQAAQGDAERFLQIVRPFQSDPSMPDAATDSLSRRLALERYYNQTIAEILQQVKGQVFLDTGQPVDLTILRSLKLGNTESSPETSNQSP